jgi:hypothetical protein
MVRTKRPLSLCIPFRTEDLEKPKASCRSSAGASIAGRLIVIPFRLISLHLVPAKHASSYTASGANKAILACTVELQTGISQAHAFPGAAPLGRKGIRWAVCIGNVALSILRNVQPPATLLPNSRDKTRRETDSPYDRYASSAWANKMPTLRTTRNAATTSKNIGQPSGTNTGA